MVDEVVIEKKWYAAKEIAELCGVSKMSFTRFVSNIDVTRESKVVNTGKNHNIRTVVYTENVLKSFQAWLMKNQANQGKSSNLVKASVENAVKQDLAIQTIIESGNVKAMECLMQHYINETIQSNKVKQLKNENKQLNHALGYDKVKDWLRWKVVKKELKYKGNFESLATKYKLVEGENFERKIMGMDKYATIMICPETVEMLFEETK